MAIFVILILFLFVVIFLFSSKKFSPIPYFPTQQADLSKIIEALKLKNNQTVIDLGAGDGIIIFKAAEQAMKEGLNTKFVAVEINPVLIFVMHLRLLFHTNKNNIKIVLGDMFKINPDVIARNKMTKQSQKRRLLRFARNDTVLYLYISPWFLEKVTENWKLKIEKLRIVSYMYPIKSLKKKGKVIHGKNSIFAYDL